MPRTLKLKGENIVVPELIDKLDFHGLLNWDKFQALCTDLMLLCYNENSREYLTEGGKQEGIDVYTFDTSTGKLIVAQCKLKESVHPAEIDRIINEFLEGEFATRTKEFIICTSYDLGKTKKLEDKIFSAKKTLKKRGIDLTVWDQQGLSVALRNNPSENKCYIIYRHFGEAVALAFLGEIFENWTKKFTEIKKIPFLSPINHIPRTLTLHENQSEDLENYLRYEDQNRPTLLSLIEKRGKNPQHIVLLSTAGYGKTEEIKTIASYYSVQDKFIYPIPFFLRDYTGDGIENIIEKAYKKWHNLPEEHLLLLFDGLDELQDMHFQLFIDNLNAFVVRHPKANIVISSRFNFYDLKTSPLRGFSVYVLNQLTRTDINTYLENQLNTSKSIFLKRIKENKLAEYSDNPYYLTRLVRFYLDKDIPFPHNKSEFFKTILFERFEKDNAKFRTEDLEVVLYPIAQKIAIIMTLTGRSSLLEAELKQIVQDANQRELLKQVCILNKNGKKIGNWSFEHKNLQEFLCGDFFSHYSFTDIHPVISLPFDRNKLVPKLLNATSFLFEQLPKDSDLFKSLFTWIESNQPELLVRFEKEQISPSTRETIFVNIFNWYKLKGLSIHISSNFSTRELASFVGINDCVIKFLTVELKDHISDRLAISAIELLGFCEKPHLYEKSLKEVFFETLLNPSYGDDVNVSCIDALKSVDFLSKDIFEVIINSGINLQYFHTRRALIRFLSYTNYFEQYDQFILDSISVFENGQKGISYSGSTDMLKTLILKFSTAKSIKALLQYCIVDPRCVSRDHEYNSLNFNLKEIESILTKASALYKNEPGMLRLVYRIFNGRKNGPYYDKWREPFSSFFKNTCGVVVIFHKIYKHDKTRGDVVAFADKSCCDFLIDEYLSGKIGENEMCGYRNLMSYDNRDLFQYFYSSLNERTNNAFIIEDLDVDYGDIYRNYVRKNREMLLNQDLFLDEAKIIFTVLKKEKITQEDLLWTNATLRQYRHSYVYDEISSYRRRSHDKLVTQSAFISKYSQKKHWETYVINKIFYLLDGDKKQGPIHVDLIAYATDYCSSAIEKTNFDFCLRDKADSYTYLNHTEFLRQLILKLQPQLSDENLTKILPCEPDGYTDNEDNITLSQFVIQNIKNKSHLKEVVLNNLASGKLSTLSMCTHFWVATKMSYTECSGQLYNFIIKNDRIKGYEKRLLTKFYLELGGEIEDFFDYLKAPDPLSRKDSMSYSSWEWYLIEEYKDKSITIPILMEIISNIFYTDENRTSACRLLIKTKQIAGLRFWAEYIQLHNKVPFDGYRSDFQNEVAEMPSSDTIPILLNTLEYAYKAGLYRVTRLHDQLDHIIYECFYKIANNSQDNYDMIKSGLDDLADRYKTEPFGYTILHYSERITQQYYEQLNYSPSIKEALDLVIKLENSI